MKAASLDTLLNLVSLQMEQVNAMILSRTGSEVLMIPEVAQHLISSGGKRLRPILTLAFARLAGYEGQGHIKLAASVEFMHTATLLHDDVVDDSDMRRGKPAARKLWGNEASVLVGDFLLGQAFKMMVEVGSLHALDSLSTAACVIAEGEVMQLNAAKKMTTNESLYLQIIHAKTAALFATACEMGPIIAQISTKTQQAARDYGQNLGMAFQLMDDVLDYAGDAKSLGKNTGDDFREGKITLPVILAYAQGTQEEQSFWVRTLTQHDIFEGDLEEAKRLLTKYKALETTLLRAKNYGEKAKAALADFPTMPLKTALSEAVDYCIERAV